MTAFYNEINKYAAQWIRNLIAVGHIAPGVVDERSIEDIKPEELYGYTQCHFFAGVGVWSFALRLAGWPDDRPVWTGSCPCQPFSAAGAGAGFADERHLWPAFHHLIAECRPPEILGEQVASSAVDAWIDLVHADLEALGYRFGSVPFPSAGVGAPHIRDRNYWAGRLADTSGERHHRGGTAGAEDGARRGRLAVAGCGELTIGLADADGRHASAERQQRGGEQRQQPQDGRVISLADAARSGRGEKRANGSGSGIGDCQEGIAAGLVDGGCDLRPGPTNGFWRDADWLGCRDGKWRPVEPGTFPLAHGAASRVGRLRAYGNAINAEAARVFVEAVMGAV